MQSASESGFSFILTVAASKNSPLNYFMLMTIALADTCRSTENSSNLVFTVCSLPSGVLTIKTEKQTDTYIIRMLYSITYLLGIIIVKWCFSVLECFSTVQCCSIECFYVSTESLKIQIDIVARINGFFCSSHVKSEKQTDTYIIRMLCMHTKLVLLLTIIYCAYCTVSPTYSWVLMLPAVQLCVGDIWWWCRWSMSVSYVIP